MLDAPRRVIAVDWSGRGGLDQSKHIWLAEVNHGVLLRLESGRSRTELVRHLAELADADPGIVVGLDFAFSLPAWYLRHREISSPAELWELLEGETLTARMDAVGLHAWIQEPDWPFWKRAKPRDLAPEREFRQTELEVRKPGTQPKSVFQLVGGGQVGPSSLYGMQALHALSRLRFSIWPFDEPRLPLVVEIFPRTLTGKVVKSDFRARARFLHDLNLDAGVRAAAVASDDAFDTLISALRMAQHVSEVQRLQREPEYLLEGKIWTAARQP